jgi:hypothetical protein
MKILLKEQYIYYTLRIAAAMCFIGHGTFGIIIKPIWCNYFAVFGIGHGTAYQLMPILGTIDILIGLSLLVYPVRAIAGWLVIWGLITASLRPLSGEPFAELIERAGNFGAPLALLVLCGVEYNLSSWFKKLTVPGSARPDKVKKLQLVLRYVAFLLLAGHGWLNLADKKSLLQQYTSLGFHNTQQVALIAGLTEIAMALLVLIKPIKPLLLVFIVWKVSTELFYPHWEAFEWLERAGSYGTLLALWFTLDGGTTANEVKTFQQAAV